MRTAALVVCISLLAQMCSATALSVETDVYDQPSVAYCGLTEHQHNNTCFESKLICGYGTSEESDSNAEELSDVNNTNDDYAKGTSPDAVESSTLNFNAEDDFMYSENGKAAQIENESVTEIAVENADTYAAEINDTSDEINHIHTDECYETICICGYDYEHVHTLSCYSNPNADVETAEDWEETIACAELTGDFATDLVAVAKTQLGYMESTDNYATMADADGNEYISGYYSRYGAWRGDPYGEWNAAFVAFCLSYAKVPESAFPISYDCENWVSTLSSAENGFELYYSAGAYSPYPGDLVFLDADYDGTADRVGIVCTVVPTYEGCEEYYEDDESYTLTGIKAIEGDVEGCVEVCEYEADSSSIIGYGALSMVNGMTAQSTEIADVTALESFYLWIYDSSTTRNEVLGFAPWESDDAIDDFCFSKSGIDDALTYTDEDGNVFYLIPIQYFLRVESKLNNFSFSEEDTDICPFVYAPSAYQPSSNLTDAAYVTYDGEWYVQVQDTTGLTPHRANIYYDESKLMNSFFTLTYGDYTITVNIADSLGNEIYGDYSSFNMSLDSETKYVFGTGNTSYALTGDESGTILDLPVPEIADYEFSGAKYSSHSVASFATGGFVNYRGNKVNLFQFYITEPPDMTQSAGQWYSASGSCSVTLIYTKEMHVVTDVADAQNTVINLFDYWITTPNDENDYHRNGDTYDSYGINAGHELNFHYTTSATVGNLNKWTGSNGGVLQGIVQDTLGNDGFPALSGNTSIGLTETASESLAYLFDPNITDTYKASYRNVQGLLQVDSTGYYYYDCKENFAEFHEETNSFTLYEESGCATGNTTTAGQFFPFDTIDEAYPLSSGDISTLNHYFGMALTTRFIQQNNGYTTALHDVPATFEFSGDDDIWIFIDGILVADLGGIHDAVSVEINFVNGTVTIDNVYDGENGKNEVISYFKDIFAGTDIEMDSSNTTLKDGTTHTLKFFYLERGAGSSNLMLKYNLTSVPDTSVYKIDQYGNNVPGATFAVYRYDYTGAAIADSSPDEYGYITESGNTVSLQNLTKMHSAESMSDNSYCVDPVTGTITVNYGADNTSEAYTIQPAYVGTTDANGEMVFLDPDGATYSQAELVAMFGEYFILREINIPDGYRTVSDDIILYFEGDLLQCYQPYSTGVWANPNALVTATNTLYIADSEYYDTLKTDSNITVNSSTGAINGYYDPTTGTTYGTLFAVVMKRNTGDDSEITLNEIKKSWQPVYGNDETGYTVLSFGDGDEYDYPSQMEAVLKAATEQYALNSSIVFSPSSSGMQALITDLPGEASRYYTYMLSHDIEFTTLDPQYLIAYYYTTADSLEKATAENTVWVSSHGGTRTASDNNGVESTITYNAFTVQWGATIEVPNIVNSLYFQKADSFGNLLNDAVFALYDAVADSDNTGYYVADKSNTYIILDKTLVDGTAITSKGSAIIYTGSIDYTTGTVTVGNGVIGSYSIDTEYTDADKSGGYIANAGTIRVTAADGAKYTISPAVGAETGGSVSLVGYTHDKCDTVSEKGTGHFQYLKQGIYFLKEIEAPSGYGVNYTNIPVAVTEDAVYANAGNVDNNVRVGNGVGYLVKTMDVFASIGEIDETLGWVYTHLKREYQTTGDFLNNIDNVFYSSSEAFAFDGYAVPGSISTNYIPEGALADNNVNVTPDDAESAMVQYLRYAGDLTAGEDDSKIFDYELYDRGAGYTTGAQSYRLWTEVGWSDLAIFQDYAYGSAQTTTGNITKYTELAGEISHLFSSSTFVQVTDEYSVGNLEISKTVLPDTEEEFSFTLTLTAGEKMVTALPDTYTYTVYDIIAENGIETKTPAANGAGTIIINTVKDDAGNITSQSGTAEFTLKNSQVLVIENLPYGTEYSVSEILPEQGNGSVLPYVTTISVNGGDTTESKEISGTLTWQTDIADVDANVYYIDYTNALLPLVEVIKVDSSNENIKLEGAKFVMYREITATDDHTVTEYYNSLDGRWYELADSENESKYAMTTGLNGELMIANMNEPGTYYLKELAAPDGYNLMTEKIEFKVDMEQNGDLKIVLPTKDSDSNVYAVTGLSNADQQLNMVVYNTPAAALPNTGGHGTFMFTLAGLLLITVAFMCGVGEIRKRKKLVR